MIQHLIIQNLVLVQRAEIFFGQGLNILTGETGSGKSAILFAIKLLLGERADIQLIRNGADIAIVEATIHPGLSKKEPLHVRREVHRSGRSRAFINDEQVSLQELRSLLCQSIQLVDQSSSLLLFSSETQRELLDTFAKISTETLAASVLKEKELASSLQELLSLQKTKEEEEKIANEALSAIAEVNWRTNEEEELSQEHHLLTHGQELLDKISSITETLTEGESPVTPLLKRFCSQLEQLLKIDPKLSDALQLLKTGAIELQEASQILVSYAGHLEVNPHRLMAVEQRIGAIESLKKRFGSFAKVEEARQFFSSKLDQMESLDGQIEEKKKELSLLTSNNLSLAAEITQKRKKGASLFETAILKELKELDLPYARLSLNINEKALGETGQDLISYLFSANPGQPLKPLDSAPSGGELSRLLFAIKVALADREKSSSLIFDEIDSNVGGKTAALLGEKLEAIAKHRQVICVTHFVQVAKKATDHFVVSKKTKENTTLTNIEKLDDPEKKEEEYGRMIGRPIE